MYLEPSYAIIIDCAVLYASPVPMLRVVGKEPRSKFAVWTYLYLSPSYPEVPDDPAAPAAPEVPEVPASPDVPEVPAEPVAPVAPAGPVAPVAPIPAKL
jgi:hypothetical protein